jgi:hypothetical protein
LGSWDSFVVAVGLAASLAPFLVAGSLAMISLLLFHYYKRVKHEKIPSKAQKVRSTITISLQSIYRVILPLKIVLENQKQERVQTLVFSMADEVLALKQEIDGLRQRVRINNATFTT